MKRFLFALLTLLCFASAWAWKPTFIGHRGSYAGVMNTVESYINGVDMEGYTDADGNFLAYYTDDSGNGSFYLYDEKTDTFYEYMSVEKSAENLYRALFYVFIALSVIQSTFIVILVYVIRRIITNRTNPRPKRV